MPNDNAPGAVLITGASGFIGGEMARRLAESGRIVIALDLPGRPVAHLSRSGIRLCEGDVTSRSDCERALAGAGAVIHCAALMGGSLPPGEAMRINAGGTETLATAAGEAGVRRFVYISSVTVHGMPPRGGITEESPLVSIGLPYADSKIAAEAALQRLQRSGAIDLAILRPGDVYGPRSGEWVVKLVEALRAGKMIYIGGGRGLVNTTWVDNLTDAAIACLDRPRAAGEAFLITDGTPVTWRRYLEALARAARTRPPRISIPTAIAWPLVLAMEAALPLLGMRPPLGRLGLRLLTSRSAYSIERAKRELGWRPVTGFEQGMSRIAEWIADEKKMAG
jgi:nucleoside-diphosphate-sugar epimerase